MQHTPDFPIIRMDRIYTMQTYIHTRSKCTVRGGGVFNRMMRVVAGVVDNGTPLGPTADAYIKAAG